MKQHIMIRPPRDQQGVVLVVALIMMAVIAISSAAAIKSVTAQDLIGSNQRNQSMAMQAAESGLRYCEALVSTSKLTAAQAALLPKIQDAVPMNYGGTDASGKPLRPKQHWEVPENWTGSNKRSFELPDTFKFDRGQATYDRPPECLIERLDLKPIDKVYDAASPPLKIEAFQVTVRGFSPDYSENANGTPATGAVIWLQSTVQQ